ncbi:MAG: TonB family protein [Pyrinomonadaceae bacterium]|nr:TonB family protein [Pyrinomonadaceae bacterium]
MLTLRRKSPISDTASIVRAASNGDADAVRALLAEGLDVDQRARGGQTALMIAAIFNYVDVARLLLAAGADVRLRDDLGLTAREWADRRGSWEIAQLLSNGSSAGILPSPKNPQAQPKVEGERENPAVEAESAPQHNALGGTEEQLRTEADFQPREVDDVSTSLSERGAVATWPSTGATRREAEPERQTSATETTIAQRDDALRFSKLHKRIMADRARREAEEARHASPIKTRITPPQDASTAADEHQISEPNPQPSEVGDGATSLSERGAVATWSSTGTAGSEVEEARHASPIDTRTKPEQDAQRGTNEQQITMAGPHSREVDDFKVALSERGAVATRSSTEASRSEVEEAPHASPIDTRAEPKQDAPSVAAEEQRTRVDLEWNKAKEVRPTATQSSRIAARLEHMRILEESRQRVEDEVRAKSQRDTTARMESGERGLDRRAERGPRPSVSAEVPYSLGLEVDDSERDTTLERRPAELSTRPAMLEPRTGESSNPPPIKRCPKCNTTYGNPLLTYCAYDATRLITAGNPEFNYSTANDWSRPTLWAMMAIIVVLGSSLGYLINNYRTREKGSNAPVAAPAAQLEQPENPRKNLPIIGGELSGMEVDVPEPEYPAKARSEGVSGTVTVRVQVNKKGRVVLVRSSGGDSRLRAAAVAAASKATFSPEKLADQGRDVSGTITYNFVAQTESPIATGSQAPAQRESPAATESQAPTQTNSPSANESSSATESSATNVGGHYPVVGGPLVGAESKLPQPNYPEQAKSKGINGTVTILVRVNREGKVISWRTLEGDSQLRAAALKAAKKAIFSPSKLPGKGEVVGTITYNFKP